MTLPRQKVTGVTIKRGVTPSAKSKVAHPAAVSHEEATIAAFREDPALAAEYLNQVLADGSREEVLLAMRYLTRAFGGVTGVARVTKLNARTLYRTLSERGNPEFGTLTAVLQAMGLRLAVVPMEPTGPRRTRTA